MEEWRDICGYEDRYEVSNYGRVRTKHRVCLIHREQKQFFRPFKQKIKKLSLDAYGYHTASLVKNKKERHLTVHRLVALAFLGSCPSNYDVHHKDGNKGNNHLENLEYRPHGTHVAEHMRTRTGEKNNSAKLTKINVNEIRTLLSSGSNRSEVANKYSVSKATIANIANGKVWKG